MRARIYVPGVSGLLSKAVLAILLALVLVPLVEGTARAQTATDPGVRGVSWCTGCANGAGGFVQGLNSAQASVEQSGSEFIAEVNRVAGGTSTKRVGLGARFDSNSCTGCHAYPANGGSSIGGSATLTNPLFTVYNLMGDQNVMPFFETLNGPTVVARAPYKSDLVTPDGNVQRLFVITGRSDAGTCDIQQPDFNMLNGENNLIFRQTTPFFGGGYVEIINDSSIIANMTANLTQKMALGISGHPNTNADDGSITRFGWKAQQRTLLTFDSEAYAVEEGIDDESYPNKIDETPGCTPPFPEGPPNGNGTHGVPDDRTDWATLPATGYLMPGDPERFAYFGRLLAAPQPSSTCPGGNTSSCVNGETQFASIGCVLCHTATIPNTSYVGFTTPPSSIAALGNAPVNLFSDLLVHDMGLCDADNVSQGTATGDQFRTAPLWGVGQRAFFMHDARTSNIVQAILDHSDKYNTPCTGVGSYPASEANAVIDAFVNLANVSGVDGSAQQDLVNFLRTL